MFPFHSRLILLAGCFLISGAILADEKTVTGKVKSIDAAKNAITIDDLTLDVSRKTKITIKGKSATLAEIKQGQNADVKYEDELDTAISIVVGPEPASSVAEAPTHKGTIVSIDLAKRRIKIAVDEDTKAKPREFEISRKAKISLNGASAELRELKAKQFVELEVESDPAVIAAVRARTDELMFVSLFDGKTLEGWNGELKLWKISNGVMVGQGPGPAGDPFCLVSTDKTFANFVLKMRFKSSAHDSGVLFRATKNVMDGPQVLTGTWEPGNVSANENGQVQLLGKVDEKVLRAIASGLKKDGWYELKITAIDDHITVHVNGVRTVDANYPNGPKDGHISLKLRGQTELRIKAIEIAQLP